MFSFKFSLKYRLVSCILLSSLFGISQSDNSIYQTEFENVPSNTYVKKLIRLSKNSLPKNWQYSGREIHTDDSLFYFGNDKLSNSFPTHCKETHNAYIIIYYSQKSAKCPTLFSLLKYYEKTIERELEKNGLPKELKLIPAVCSGFNPNSNNGIGGYGYWHLYHPQGIKYGLNINEFVDERRDFEKSTKAATSFLKDLYIKYKDWELTLAAYSSGVVNVNKLIKRHNTSNYNEIVEFLPKETKDFVEAFVAINYIYNYDNYGVIELNPHITQDTIKIERKLKFKAINDVIKTKSSDLSFLNPSIIAETFPSNSYGYLPKGYKDKFESFRDSIYYYQDSILLKPEPKESPIAIPVDGSAVEYTVRSGDVLGLIAERYNVRVSQLQAWNNLDGTRINIGQKLMIYSKSPANRQSPKKTNNKKEEPKETTKPNLSFSNDKYTTYTVKSGDNLWLIAKKFSGVSAQNIMDFNGIDANLDIGQVLKIPKP